MTVFYAVVSIKFTDQKSSKIVTSPEADECFHIGWVSLTQTKIENHLAFAPGS